MIALILTSAATVRAEPDPPSLSELKAQLLKLRNTDLTLSQRDLWEKTAAQLEAWTLRSNDKIAQADALFHSALAYQEIAERANDLPTARLAISLFERFCAQFSQDKLCPDGLIRAAQLSQASLSDPKRAGTFYNRIVRQYPGSEAAIVSRSKLRQDSSTGAQTLSSDTMHGKSDDGKNINGAGKLPVIVIDPGHGGDDLGATGTGGLLEKDVVLAIALELRELATKKPGFKVVLTRDSDKFIPLAQRTALANSENGLIFISIHANASPSHTLSGIESYFLDNTDDYAAKRLAEIENAAGSKVAGSELDLILSDMVQGAKVPHSAELAQTIQREVLSQVKKSGWAELHDHGVKKAPFFVLVGARMPCTLIEVAYIDNEADGQNLATPEFRSALAHGILTGIERYVSAQSKEN